MSDQTKIVTFNYDVLVEAAVEYLLVSRQENPAARLVGLQLSPRLIPYDPTRRTSGGGSLPLPASPWSDLGRLSLYKLHGSTCWFWDDLTRSTDSMIDVGLRSGWAQPQPFEPSRVPGKLPVIVPPTTSKSGFFRNGIIREIWRGAYDSLRRADRVFVLGYSLPPADLVVRSLPTEAFRAKHPEVWLVNTRADTDANYRDLGMKVNTEFCLPDRPIPQFAEHYISA